MPHVEEKRVAGSLLALLRLGHIRVSNCENEKGMLVTIEIGEG
jgi:hypothetical protein